MGLSSWFLSTREASSLTVSEIIDLQSLLEGAARMVIYTYTLSIALFAFARYNDFIEIAFISSLIIMLSLAYGSYVAIEVWKTMKTHGSFVRFNYMYYLLLFAGLFSILVLLMINYEEMWKVKKDENTWKRVKDSSKDIVQSPRKRKV